MMNDIQSKPLRNNGFTKDVTLIKAHGSSKLMFYYQTRTFVLYNMVRISIFFVVHFIAYNHMIYMIIHFVGHHCDMGIRVEYMNGDYECLRFDMKYSVFFSK